MKKKTNLELLKRRLYFRAWHRGTRELDLILGTFAEKYLSFLTLQETLAFAEILTISDPEIYGWITETIPIPPEYNHKLTYFLKIVTRKQH